MKGHNLVTKRESRDKSAPFRGTLAEGIDVRRTLRSFWNSQFTRHGYGNPHLSQHKSLIYISEHVRQRKNKDCSREPIVWLFELVEKPDYHFTETRRGPKKEPRIRASFEYVSPTHILYKSKQNRSGKMALQVSYHEVLGYVAFCNMTNQLQKLEAFFGDELTVRVPRQRIEDLFPRKVIASLPWWELLLLTALKYAKETVLCVVPEGFQLPQSLVSQGAAQGKSFLRIPLTKFSKSERQKIACQYWLDHTSDSLLEGEDINDPRFKSMIAKTYSRIMKRFWND